MREVYVISDLHIGGEPAGSNELRGFQINTHTHQLANFINLLARKSDKSVELVINGDLVDFLAETPWTAFEKHLPNVLIKLNNIFRREAHVFNALKTFLQNSKHRLTLLLGNHDIELSLPHVRAILEKTIGATSANFRFLFDGEAYSIGNEVLIEHGNRYDSWNSVDDNRLRQFREKMSRNEKADSFTAPKGSELVEKIMNPMKVKYPFVDMLKPETGAAIPILLALEPQIRSKIDNLLRIYLSDMIPEGLGIRTISSGSKGNESLEENLVNKEMQKLFSDAELQEFLTATDALSNPAEEAELSSVDGTSEKTRSFRLVHSLWQLLTANNRQALYKRLPALLTALKSLQSPKTFDLDTETFPEYLQAATQLSENGFKYIIFGHTHLARRINLPNGGVYINSGTWADLMKFPTNILDHPDKHYALEQLERFIEEITGKDLIKHIIFKPTCVYIALDEHEHVTDIQLQTYDEQAMQLRWLA